jgi:DNA-binding SARP family transcriptional activator
MAEEDEGSAATPETEPKPKTGPETETESLTQPKVEPQTKPRPETETETARNTLRFSLLGPVQAWRDGIPLDLGPPQQRAVVAALLLREGRAATAAQLVDAIWGEDPPPRAVAALRTYVSRLRATLEPSRPARMPSTLLVSVADGYALRAAPGSVDAIEFERLLAEAERTRQQAERTRQEAECAQREAARTKQKASRNKQETEQETEQEIRARYAGQQHRIHAILSQAIDLWQGTPLTGVPGPYAERQRDRLSERRLVAIESRLELDLELGRHVEAIGELTALVTEYPLRERLRALLMLALYRAGRQAEALGAYAALRAVLIDELGIEPGPGVAELHARILAADPALAVTATTTAARTIDAAPPPTTKATKAVKSTKTLETPENPERHRQSSQQTTKPAQLPADVADFTGRETLTARLREILTTGVPTAVPVAVIIGSGGVGKTALAVHVAQGLRAEFPDGQLYAHLRGTDPRPADVGDILLSFLRSLGVEERAVPEAVEHRSALLRSTLAGRRVLVVLDNARDSSQVRQLLPGAPGCAVLVTSRNAMADLPGARFVDLGVLPPDEALALFARIAGEQRATAEPGAAREVVAACGHLPLAVRIVASRLSTRPAWSVAALAGRLGDERRRLDELKLGDLAVESSFRLSYAQLRPDQSRAFRLLAVPEVPDLALASAAALLDRDEPTAEDLCESLVDACLLESSAPGRYRFNDLVKLYARRQVQQAERGAALARLLDFYIATVSHLLRMRRTERTERIERRERIERTERMGTPGGEPREHMAGTRIRGVPLADLEAAQRWLAEERTGLFSVVYQAALEPGWPVALAIYLVLAMCECVDADGARGDAEWAMAALMGAAVFSGRRHAATPSPGRLSAPLLPRGSRGQITNLSGAAQLAEACALLDSTGVARMAAWSTFLRGTAALMSGDAEGAVRLHMESIDLLKQSGESWGDGMLYSLMIKAHRDAGSFAAGTAVAERALAVARLSSNRATEAFTLHELGLLTMLAGDPEKAVEECRMALDLAAATGRRNRLGYAQLRLAQTLRGAGRTAEAAEVAAAAVQTLTEASDPSQRGVALAVLAEARDALGDSGAARRTYREAAEVFTRLALPIAADLQALADPTHQPNPG